VVGSSEIRDADPDWPAPGSKFDHSVGADPLLIKDHTEVIAARPPELIQLRANARPLPSADVTIKLEPEGNGTRVTMIEDPTNLLLRVAIGPLGHMAIRLRNAESLRRLRELAEGVRPRPG
jgi:hypothetical protein